MNVIYAPLSPVYWGEIYEALLTVRQPDTAGVMAVDADTGELLAAGIADTFSYSACNVHLIIKNPLVLRHGFFEEVFNYIFNTCDRAVVVGIVPGHNKKALKLNKHLGYSELCRIKDGFKLGTDYVILELRKEDCRWIPQNTEQEAA